MANDGKRARIRNNTEPGLDILDAFTWVSKDLDGSVRLILLTRENPQHNMVFEGVYQLYRLVDGKAWVLAERTFYWPNNEGRDFMFTAQIELHRAYHKWGNMRFAPVSVE